MEEDYLDDAYEILDGIEEVLGIQVTDEDKVNDCVLFIESYLRVIMEGGLNG